MFLDSLKLYLKSPFFLVLVALFLCASAAFVPEAQARTQEPFLIEYIESAFEADKGFSEAERNAYMEAFRDELAGYARDILRQERAEGAEVLLRIVTEGSFDSVQVERTVAIATAAYIAIARGAEAELVEGIALYGFRKDVDGRDIETWANGVRDCLRFGVPGYIAEDLVFNAVEHGWDHYTFNSLKWVLVEAAKAGYPIEDFHAYMMAKFLVGSMRPGALGSEAMALFREAALKGEKPVVPEYKGSFIPRASATNEPEPEVVEPGASEAKAPEKPEPKPKEKPDAKPFAQKPEKPEKPEKKTPPRQSAKKQNKPVAKLKPSAKKAARSGILGTLERAWNSFLGVPYVWGGQTKRGTDCSGFVKAVFAEAGVQLPRVAREQWKAGREVSLGRLKKGDLVFFRTVGRRISHVGIVTDPTKGGFVHASSSRGVVYDKLSIRYFSARYAGARRVLPAGVALNLPR